AGDVAHLEMQQVLAGQLAQNAHDAAGTVHVFDVVFVGGRSELRQAGHAARQPVDVGHGEVDFGFLRSGQQVQHRVGGAAHGDVERHGVFEGLEVGDAARQNRCVV